jgi:predicted LPLAT superfamily acyltransferase
VARSVDVGFLRTRVRIASGAFLLAGLLGVPIRPIVAIPRGGRFDIRCTQPIESVPREVPAAAITRAIDEIVGEFPDEWWLWPYIPQAE